MKLSSTLGALVLTCTFAIIGVAYTPNNETPSTPNFQPSITENTIFFDYCNGLPNSVQLPPNPECNGVVDIRCAQSAAIAWNDCVNEAADAACAQATECFDTRRSERTTANENYFTATDACRVQYGLDLEICAAIEDEAERLACMVQAFIDWDICKEAALVVWNTELEEADEAYNTCMELIDPIFNISVAACDSTFTSGMNDCCGPGGG